LGGIWERFDKAGKEGSRRKESVDYSSVRWESQADRGKAQEGRRARVGENTRTKINFLCPHVNLEPPWESYVSQAG